MTTNYKPISVDQKPEKEGWYDFPSNDVVKAMSMYWQDGEWLNGPDGEIELYEPIDHTHYLVAIPDSIILTREQIEAIWDASQKWSAAPMKAERENILRGYKMAPKNYLEIPDKQTYINNLLNKTT